MSALDHVTHSCAKAGCFAIITMHPAEEARLRHSHETFYCPAGHPNYFAGRTAQEKQIASLERQRKELLQKLHDQHVDACEQRHVRTLLVDAIRSCPLGCGWNANRRVHGWAPSRSDFYRLIERVERDLVDHLIADHGTAVPERDDERVAA